MSISNEAFAGHIGNTATFAPRTRGQYNTFHQYERQGKELHDRCAVDIIIPFHAKYENVRKLASSLLYKTRSNPIRLTLIDDGSPNPGFLETISQAPRTQTIRLDQQKGFGNAVRIGLENTSLPYVCIMHSDCEIYNSSWLEELGASLLTMKQDNVRMVAPRSNNPTSDIEALHAEATDQASEDAIVNVPLPLYCVLCHRELFNRIGGPLKSYPYTWYEDEELFWRMKKHGYRQGISGRSWVHHEGHATIQHLWKKDPTIKEVMKENRNLCLKDIESLRLVNPSNSAQRA